MSRQFVNTVILLLLIFALGAIMLQVADMLYHLIDQVQDAASAPMQIQ